jgi:hypothetical protein
MGEIQMALTPEQNEQINTMRNQLQQMLTALNQLARQVGADPIPLTDEELHIIANPLPQIQKDEITGAPGPNYNPIVYYEAPGVVNGIRVAPQESLASAMAAVLANAAKEHQQQQPPQQQQQPQQPQAAAARRRPQM